MSDDLVAFLRARYDEDLHTADRLASTRHGVAIIPVGDGEDPITIGPQWLRSEVEAKRKMLGRYEALAAGVWVLTSGVEEILSEYRRAVLPQLALPYADHPDYRAEWRP